MDTSIEIIKASIDKAFKKGAYGLEEASYIINALIDVEKKLEILENKADGTN